MLTAKEARETALQIVKAKPKNIDRELLNSIENLIILEVKKGRFEARVCVDGVNEDTIHAIFDKFEVLDFVVKLRSPSITILW